MDRTGYAAGPTPGGDVPARTKKSSRRLLYAIVAFALVAGTGTAVWIVMASNHGQAGNQGRGPRRVKSVLHLEGFLVNLSDQEENRFLRVGIDLGLERELAENAAEGKALMPRIRDTVLARLGTWQSSALIAPEGKTKLKDDLVQALRQRVPELGVREVYFTDFLVQR